MEKDEYDPFQVKKLLKALRNQMIERTDKARQATYEIIISDRIRTYDEAFIASLQESDFDEKILYEEALWLLTHAAHREVIKVALILMSYCPIDETDESLIFTIAHHEEFTKYAILPLLRRSEEHTSELQSRGHLVCRLLLEKRTQQDQTRQERWSRYT